MDQHLIQGRDEIPLVLVQSLITSAMIIFWSRTDESWNAKMFNKLLLLIPEHFDTLFTFGSSTYATWNLYIYLQYDCSSLALRLLSRSFMYMYMYMCIVSLLFIS